MRKLIVKDITTTGPSIDGFDTYYTGRASHITFINNVSTTKIEFSYVLIPRTVGKFTLPGIEVFVGKDRYQTQPISLEVMAGGAQQARTQPVQRPTRPTPPDFGALRNCWTSIWKLLRSSLARR